MPLQRRRFTMPPRGRRLQTILIQPLDESLSVEPFTVGRAHNPAIELSSRPLLESRERNPPGGNSPRSATRPQPESPHHATSWNGATADKNNGGNHQTAALRPNYQITDYPIIRFIRPGPLSAGRALPPSRKICWGAAPRLISWPRSIHVLSSKVAQRHRLQSASHTRVSIVLRMRFS